MSENPITLSDMSAPSKARKAARLASMAEDQAEPATPAISPAPREKTERQPEKRTVSGITRNIEATEALMGRIKGRIAAHRKDSSWDHDGEALTAWKKQLANLEERLAILHRLRDKEIRYDDR